MTNVDNLECLNTRQQVLARVLLDQPTWIKRRELLQIPIIATTYEVEANKDIYFSRAARLLTSDLQQLNNNTEFPYVIIQNSYNGIKIYRNTKEDFDYLKKEYIKLVKGLARYNTKIQKIQNSNLQKLDLVFASE